MTYTELKESISTWDMGQKEACHFLLGEGDTLEDIITLIDNYEFRVFESMEDYIISKLEEAYGELPKWVCIDIIETYNYRIQYDDNIMFMSDLPKWAEGRDLYGTEEQKQKYRDSIEYLCDYSRVLEVYR